MRARVMDFALSWGEREKNGQQTKAIKAGDNPFQLDWLQTTGVKWILKEISHIKRRHLSGWITAPLAAFDGTETKCSLHTVVWLNMHGSECIRRLHACYSGNGEPGALEAFCFLFIFLCSPDSRLGRSQREDTCQTNDNEVEAWATLLLKKKKKISRKREKNVLFNWPKVYPVFVLVLFAFTRPPGSSGAPRIIPTSLCCSPVCLRAS